LQACLDKGADPNVVANSVMVPLLRCKIPEIAEVVLEAGADPNCEIAEEFSVLYQAICLKNQMVVEKLLKNGAWPFFGHRCGLSPRQRAELLSDEDWDKGAVIASLKELELKVRASGTEIPSLALLSADIMNVHQIVWTEEELQYPGFVRRLQNFRDQAKQTSRMQTNLLKYAIEHNEPIPGILRALHKSAAQGKVKIVADGKTQREATLLDLAKEHERQDVVAQLVLQGAES